jgi:hypothetical protein
MLPATITRTLLTTALAAATAAATLGTATSALAAGTPTLTPPTDVRVASVNPTEAVLAWTPISTNPNIGYQIETTGGEFFSLGGPNGETLRFIDPGTTLNLVVRSYFFDGTTMHESAPSRPVEVRTPTPPPLEPRLVSRDGNNVTLSWTRPVLGAAPVPLYRVHDGSALETTSTGTQVTIRRLQAGQTHRLTVSYEFSKYGTAGGGASTSPPSQAITVEVPSTGDSTPPTAPTNVTARFDLVLCETVLTWTASTDNATPASQLEYELVDNAGGVVTYNVRSPHSLAAGQVLRLRAVDASGNRSAPVPITFQ